MSALPSPPAAPRQASALRVLALDPSFSGTGWATNCREGAWPNPKGEILSGAKEFKARRGCSPGSRFLDFYTWLRALIEIYKPLYVVYEQAHHRGGAATAMGEGLTAVIQMTAAEYGLEYRATHTQTLKWFATGSGSADKPAMMEAANNYPLAKGWWHVDSDDEADAVLLLAHALAGFPDAATAKAEEKARKAAERARLAQERQEARAAGKGPRRGKAGRDGAAVETR